MNDSEDSTSDVSDTILAALDDAELSEAHKCVRRQAGAKLMKKFLHERKSQGLAAHISVLLMGEHSLWYKGYLSRKKDCFVSRFRLGCAAIEAGLDSFMIAKPF
jgi:hypothetical protein